MEHGAIRQRINQLFFFLVAFFGLMFLGYVYWGGVRAPFLADQIDNPRDVERVLRIQRGAIVDTNEAVLATNRFDGEIVTRHYPNPSVAAAIGYYSFRFGVSGIESSLDLFLKGESDRFQDLWRRDVMHFPQVGGDVRLTLDIDLQNAASDALAQRTGAVILLSARDGSLRGIASQPSFDPNLIDQNFELLVEDESSPLLNRATQNRYQPGEVLLPFFLLAALQEGILTSSDIQNKGLDQLVNELDAVWGRSEFYEQLTRLGFTQEPEIGLETSGFIHESDLVLNQSVRQELLGEGNLLVTPLQVAQAALLLSAEESLPPLRLVGAVRADAGSPWEAYLPSLVSRPASVTVEGGAENQDFLNESIPDLIQFPAQERQMLILEKFSNEESFAEWVSDVESGPDATNSWYVGFAPATAPRAIVIIVMENEAETADLVEIGRELLSQTLR